jgi:hypothetical protein
MVKLSSSPLKTVTAPSSPSNLENSERRTTINRVGGVRGRDNTISMTRMRDTIIPLTRTPTPTRTAPLHPRWSTRILPLPPLPPPPFPPPSPLSSPPPLLPSLSPPPPTLPSPPPPLPPRPPQSSSLVKAKRSAKEKEKVKAPRQPRSRRRGYSRLWLRGWGSSGLAFDGRSGRRGGRDFAREGERSLL